MMIGNKLIGESQPCFIIAEIGMNHDGSKQKAEDLIAVAAEAGADAVKFQTFKALDIVNPALPADYDPQEPVPPQYEYFYQYIGQYELPYEYYDDLISCAAEHKLIFLSTPCSYGAVDFLAERIPAFKIASMDLNNMSLLEKVGTQEKPVILSTGIGTLPEIEAAVKTLQVSGAKEVALLHCVANYPAKPDELNLRNIPMLKQAFGLPVGFSDHSLGVVNSVAAVALGACIVEKHITLDRKTPGPDHYFALEPADLKELVKNIREVESALGSSERRLTDSEEQKRATYRRSLVINRDLKKGRVLQEGDISVIRPGSGISPGELSKAIGMVLKQDLKAYTPLKWEYLEP